MIRIYKSAAIPAVLQKEGMAATQSICRLMEAQPEAFRSTEGKSTKQVSRFPFENAIYGHASVKKQLIADQKEKCCFCESKFLATSAGDVEHYRPKGAFLKLGGISLTFPGYYWLAYDWDNLLFACENCNRRFKRNHFPLEDDDQRVCDHRDAALLADEVPLLINPLLENPEDYITFEAEVPKPKGDSPRGELAIACYGLGRKALNDARATHLEYLRLLRDSLAADGIQEELRKRIQSFLNKATLPSAPYAAMIRANFPDLPRG